MTAKTAVGLVVGYIVLVVVQAVVKALLPAYPFTEAVAAEWAALTSILTTKVINDVQEMKAGIAEKKLAKAGEIGC